MNFKDFMEMYDNWNGITKVNDNNLNVIVEGHTLAIMECTENFTSTSSVENYEKLFAMKVVAFGFYDDELCVRVKDC